MFWQKNWARIAEEELGTSVHRSRPGDNKKGSYTRWIRHPVRAAAMGMAGVALAAGLTTSKGVVAAGVGAVVGVLFGELIARTRWRLWVLLGGLALLLVGLWALGGIATRSTGIPEAIGPSAALGLGVILRFGIAAFAITAALRILAARKPSLVVLELFAVAGALAVLFAAHRDGVIDRPLWLSDWAFRRDLDPADILMIIGGSSVVVLTIVMVAEHGRRLSIASVLALPILVALVVMFLGISDISPSAAHELGKTHTGKGDEPNPTPPGGVDSEWGSPHDGKKQGERDERGKDGRSGDKRDWRDYPWGDRGGRRPDRGRRGQGDKRGKGKGEKQGKRKGEGQRQRQPSLEDQLPSGRRPQPMAVVLLGDDYDPPTQHFYFRQSAWSRHIGSRLLTARHPDLDADVLHMHPTRTIEMRENPPDKHRQRVKADVALLVQHTNPFALETPLRFNSRSNPNPERFVRSFSFESSALTLTLDQVFDYQKLFGEKLSTGNPEWPQRVLEHYLEESDDPRFRELAREIVEPALERAIKTEKIPEERREDPFLRALIVKAWMDANLAYSTRERHANVPDPTADFLFGNRIGYCVHFAHAAVYMWRSLGIPARVGVGYAVQADQRKGSTILIRGGDAHAWPELYLDKLGWVILDITPARNLDPPGMPVDDKLQEMLSDLARQEPKFDKQTGKIIHRQQAPPSKVPGILLLVLLSSLGGLLLLLWAAKLWRRMIPTHAGPGSIHRVGYRAALDMLTDVGLRRRFGETRERFARRIEGQAPTFGELTAMNIRACFGDPKRAQRPERAIVAWRTGLEKLRSEIRRVGKGWKRFLNRLNPLSFLWSR